MNRKTVTKMVYGSLFCLLSIDGLRSGALDKGYCTSPGIREDEDSVKNDRNEGRKMSIMDTKQNELFKVKTNRRGKLL